MSRRRRSLLGASAAAVVIAVVGLTIGLARSGGPTPTPAPAPSPSTWGPPVPSPTPPGTPLNVVSQPAKPNIVLILTDDQRWDTLWAMRNVRRDLVRHGVTFADSFVVNPLCCPSRSSILTGDYSHSTGVYTNAPPYGGYAGFDDVSTVATWLHAAGYHTGLFGKYLNGLTGTPVPPGWSQFDAFEYNTEGNYYDGYQMDHDGKLRIYGFSPPDYSTNVVRRAAVRFIDRVHAPFFAYVAPYAPHAPATYPARDANRFQHLRPYRPPSYDEADVSDKPAWVQALPPMSAAQKTFVDGLRIAQYRSLQAVDRMVGAIFRAVERTGRLSSTMFVFTSDNSVAWGEHRWARKESPYDESIHVPMVVRYDPLVTSPRTDDHLVLNIDLAPTFARLAGESVPGVEGRSMVNLLGSPDTTWRTGFLIEHLFNPLPEFDPPTYCAVRTSTALYVQYETGEQELYDLTKDPYELRNIANDPSAQPLLQRLRARDRNLCNPAPPGFTFPP